jgi:hypothetical protein
MIKDDERERWTYLFRRQNGNVIFINDPTLFFNDIGIGFVLQVLTCQPE